MENVLRPDFGRPTSHAHYSDDPEKSPDDIESIARYFLSSPKSPKFQQWVLRHWKRQLRWCFDPSQWSVIDHIHDQTVSAGRPSWGFTYERIAYGDDYTCGIGISPRQVMRIVKELATMGVISKRPTAKGVDIAPNLVWHAPETMQRSTRGRAKGKKSHSEALRGVTRDTPSSDTHVTPPVTPMSPIRGEDLGGEEIKGEAIYSAPASRARVYGFHDFDNIDDVEVSAPSVLEPPSPQLSARPELPAGCLTEKLRKTHARLATAKQKVKPGAIEETFRAAFDEAFGEYPGATWIGWTEKERAIVNNALIKKWESPHDLHHFVRWVVTDWTHIMAARFDWVKRDRPEIPSLPFLVRMLPHFLQAHASDLSESWIRSTKDHEQREYRRLTIKRGLTPEEARMRIAEGRATAKMREENRKSEQSANDAWQKARIVEERTKRMGGGAPHPNSPAARAAREQADREAIIAAREKNGVVVSDEIPDFSSIKPWGEQ